MSSSVTLAYGVNGYAEIAQLRDAYEGGFSLGTYTDPELGRLIVGVSEEIGAKTHAYFGKFTDSFEFSGNGTPHLFLHEVTSHPIISCSAVRYRSSFEKNFDWDANGIVLDENSYDIDQTRRSLVRVGSLSTQSIRVGDGIIGAWGYGHKNYRVTGEWGISEIPVLIELATILLCRERIQPGYVTALEALGGESFPDGYSYYRQQRFADRVPKYFGIDLIDRIVHEFVDTEPGIGFTL